MTKALNRKLKNKAPSEKIVHYPESRLKLNEYWKKTDVPKWEAEEIEDRQKWMSQLAAKVWSFRA